MNCQSIDDFLPLSRWRHKILKWKMSQDQEMIMAVFVCLFCYLFLGVFFGGIWPAGCPPNMKGKITLILIFFSFILSHCPEKKGVNVWLEVYVVIGWGCIVRYFLFFYSNFQTQIYVSEGGISSCFSQFLAGVSHLTSRYLCDIVP